MAIEKPPPTPTLQDAIHLAKDAGARFRLEKQESNRREKFIVLQRKRARYKAGQEYHKRRVEALHGNYDEIHDSIKLDAFPRFTQEEISCGDKLGNGAFGSVYEIKRIALEDSSNDTNQSARSFMAQHCLRDSPERVRSVRMLKTSSSRSMLKTLSSKSIDSKNSDPEEEESQDARYAIKRLRTKIIKGDREMFAQAMIDVATETRILASIPHHPNIIKLRGLAYSDSSENFPSCCFHEDFFLVLDRLYGTLDDQLSQWVMQGSQRGLGNKIWGQGKQRNEQERLLACLDLASALAHLHEHDIIHRDIKPPNIGFNIRGDLTLFDFGLSRELPHDGKSHKSKANSKLFRLTGFCGSPRYMAPEVGLRKVYNAKCDVYSFGIVAWQILTLQKPFDGCDINDLRNIVWPGGVIGPGEWLLKKTNSSRTKRFSDAYVMSKPQPNKRKQKRGIFDNFKSSKSKSKANLDSRDKVMKMIERTFKRNIAARPTMNDMEEFLRKACNNTEDGELQCPTVVARKDRSRRRSTFVFEPEEGKTDQPVRRSSMPSSSMRRKPRRKSHEDNTHHGIGFGHSSDSSLGYDHEF